MGYLWGLDDLATRQKLNASGGNMTTAQRNDGAQFPGGAASEGDFVYNTDKGYSEQYDGANWVPAAGGVTSQTSAEKEALVVGEGVIVYDNELLTHQFYNSVGQWEDLGANVHQVYMIMEVFK